MLHGINTGTSNNRTSNNRTSNRTRIGGYYENSYDSNASYDYNDDSDDSEASTNSGISPDSLYRMLKMQHKLINKMLQQNNIVNRISSNKLRDFNIVINSADRDWYNNSDESQFNFTIKFAPSSNQIISEPLYENNPTIPASVTQSQNGFRGDVNSSGWTLHGTTYAAHRPDLPPGDIVGYENIVAQSEKNAYITREYKNISYISLDRALIPSRKKKIIYSQVDHSLLHYPYLNITMSELSDLQKGTNPYLDNSGALMIPIMAIPDSLVEVKFVEYKNINQSKKEYRPSPLNSMGLLTFKCLDITGQVITNKNDTLDIKYIYYNSSDISDSRTEFLVIKTTKYFSPSEFIVGDTIVIKKYQYRNSANEQSAEFNEFINRPQGHIIIEISSDDSNKSLKNRIHISRSATLDGDSGDLIEDLWYSIFKIKGFTDDPSTITTDDSGGKLINLNMQHTYFLKIGVLEKNTDILGNEII